MSVLSVGGQVQQETLFPLDLWEAPVPVPKSGEEPKLRVEFKFCIEHVGEVDTLNSTVTARTWVGLAWIDPRLRGRAEFPEGSWAPSVVPWNSSGATDFVYIPKNPKITDSTTGQCYRLFYGEGKFMFVMDLVEYPFDHQTLTFVFRSESVHVAAVQSKIIKNPISFESYGSMATGVYPNDPNPRVVYFDDDFDYKNALPEWTFQSLALYNNNKEEPEGARGVDDALLMTVKVRVQREFTYYLNKMVMVLFMLSLFTLAVIKIDPIDEFSDRMSYLMTVFLAIVAFAFVISSSTPSMPYLTVLDRLTSASYALTFLVGLETLVAALLAENLDDDLVKRWDRIAVLALVGLSVVFYSATVGSRVKGKLNVRDAARKALEVAVEPRFLGGPLSPSTAKGVLGKDIV